MRLPMRWVRGYSIFVLAGGAAILLTIVAASFVFSNRMQADATSALRSARVDRLLLEFTYDLVNAETAQRGYIITGIEDYLEPYDEAVSQFGTDAADLRKWSSELDDGMSIPLADVDDLIAVGQKKLDAVQKNLADLKAGDVDPRQLFQISREGKNLMDEGPPSFGGHSRNHRPSARWPRCGHASSGKCADYPDLAWCGDDRHSGGGRRARDTAACSRAR